MAPPALKFSVGLEIHARLKTRHKIFCTCANHYGDEPNTNTCPVCLGLPGTLPVLNPEILQPALRAAVALGCRIPRVSQFSRKNYFYPDLPRNYQITQYDQPLALEGHLVVSQRKVRLQRIHLEEDAGRSLVGNAPFTRIDLNRAGAPLMEIVTEPDLTDGHQARQWLNRLRQLLRYLDVCDGNMEKGSLRCDANVGVAAGHELAGPWIELKNLNSFKAVDLAVNFEIKRLGSKVEKGERLRRETRAWDSRMRKTRLLRLKEEASEYRYYPEPDLPLLVVESKKIQQIGAAMPELPWAREERFSSSYGISAVDAVILCRSLQLADYFETCADVLSAQGQIALSGAGPLVAKWVLSHVLEAVGGRDESLPALGLSPEKLAEILTLLESGKIHRTGARQIVHQIVAHPEDNSVIDIAQLFVGHDGENEALLDSLCSEVIAANSAKVDAFCQGKTGLLNYFVGQVMSRCRGLLEADKVRATLLKKLN